MANPREAPRREEAAGSGSGVLREPTVVFVAAAALLFLVSWIAGSGDERVVRIDPAEVAWRIEQAEAARGVPLTEELRREVEDTYIDQQILAREAREMGLENDPRIEDILAQKMLHVLSGDVIQPTAAELEAYYTTNLDRYTPAPTISVDEAVVPLDAPEPSRLPEALARGTPPEELVGDVLITHRAMPSLTRAEVADIFDPAFAETAFDAATGSWVGPFESVRGFHWLRIDERSAAVPLPLESVREQVRLDWIAEREEAMLEERLAELRSEYRIVREGADEG